MMERETYCLEALGISDMSVAWITPSRPLSKDDHDWSCAGLRRTPCHFTLPCQAEVLQRENSRIPLSFNFCHKPSSSSADEREREGQQLLLGLLSHLVARLSSSIQVTAREQERERARAVKAGKYGLTTQSLRSTLYLYCLQQCLFIELS